MDQAKFDSLKKLKTDCKTKTKGKLFKNLSAKEKEELLETVCKLLGLI